MGVPVLSLEFSIGGSVNLTPVFYGGNPEDFELELVRGSRIEFNSSIPTTLVTTGGFKSINKDPNSTFGIYIGVGKTLECKVIPTSPIPFQINIGTTQIYI